MLVNARPTITRVRQAGVAQVGAGLSGAAARRGVVVNTAGVRVGLLSYMEDSFMHSLYMFSASLNLTATVRKHARRLQPAPR